MPPGVGEIASIAISDRIAQLYFESFGRSPRRVRTYVQPQFAVCVLREILTYEERSMIGGGDEAMVESTRAKVNETIDGRYVSIVETETGRPVLSHLASVRLPVDVAVHFFLFDDGRPAEDDRDAAPSGTQD